MYLTESDAKQKWCPQVRFSTHSGQGDTECAVNSFGGQSRSGDLDFACIASECMMWRKVVIIPLTATALMAGVTATSNIDNKDKGYCGLAGRP